MNDDAIRGIFKGSFLFSKLGDRELDELIALGSYRRFDRDQVIFSRGASSEKLYAVLLGRIRIIAYSDDGNEIILRMIGASEVFGEIGVLDGGERTATAIASEKTEVLVVERKTILTLIEKNPTLAIKFLSAVAGRLRTTTEQLEDLDFLDVPTRLPGTGEYVSFEV